MGGGSQNRVYFGDQAQGVLGQLGNFFNQGPSQQNQAASNFFMGQLQQDPSQLNQYNQGFIDNSRADATRRMQEAFGQVRGVTQAGGRNAAGAGMIREMGNISNQQNMMENQFAGQQMNQQVANQFAAANGLSQQEAQQLGQMINFANLFKGSDQTFQQEGMSNQTGSGTENKNYWENAQSSTKSKSSPSIAGMLGGGLMGFKKLGGLSGIGSLFE
jgi:hypothetical protein